MTSRTRWLVVLVSTPLVALVAVGGLLGASSSTVSAEPQRAFAHLRVFHDVIQLILGSYVENVDLEPVMDGAMRGLADGLDSESAYLTPAGVRRLDAGEPAGPAGVGLVLTGQRQFYLRIVGVRDGSPAARGGIRSGDYLRAIDGQPTRDMSTLEGSGLLQGAPGSTVELLVIRSNIADPHTINLTREAPTGDAVSGDALESGEALIRVRSFGAETAGALSAEVKALGAAASDGLIIDLRDVADGGADAGIAAARLFVKDGPLATRAGRDTAPEVIAAGPNDGELTMPVVLLVSNGTAHAAEIFAAALQGNGRARLVGESTAGLAAEQRLVRLPAGHGLWITHQRYLTKDGAVIHGQGLTPDTPVAIPAVEWDETPPETDAVLARARELIRAPSR